MFSKILPGGAAEQAGKLGEGRARFTLTLRKISKNIFTFSAFIMTGHGPFSTPQLTPFFFQLSPDLARSSPLSSEVPRIR